MVARDSRLNVCPRFMIYKKGEKPKLLPFCIEALFAMNRAFVLLLQSLCFRQVLTSFVFGAIGSRCFSRLHPGELPVSPEKPLKAAGICLLQSVYRFHQLFSQSDGIAL